MAEAGSAHKKWAATGAVGVVLVAYALRKTLLVWWNGSLPTGAVWAERVEPGTVVDRFVTDHPPVRVLVREAIAWATTHGLVMVSDAKASVIHAPFTLLPTEIPRTLFDHACALVPSFNLLIDRASRSLPFLRSALASSAGSDPFTRRYLQLAEEVAEEGVVQPLRLGIFRSDYMLDAGGERRVRLLQVELNTIAASFGPLAARVSALHRHLLSRLSVGDPPPVKDHLPPNRAVEGISKALADAVHAHGAKTGVVLMVVQANESNAPDQRMLEWELWDTHNVRVLRRPLQYIHDHAVLQEDTRHLILDTHVVSVVYYRAAYTPRDFTYEHHWQALRTLERSSAIKCPCAAYFLMGLKKMQQHLAMPGVLETFLPPSAAQGLRAVFAGLWPLDEEDEATRAIIARASASPDAFVLKPQREGGGNNVWGEDIRRTLQTATVKERAQYILMERIRPPLTRNWLLRAGEVVTGKMENELGIFSAFLGNGRRILFSRQVGHLVRTKLHGVDEGGVATGYAVLDSPCLV